MDDKKMRPPLPRGRLATEHVRDDIARAVGDHVQRAYLIGVMDATKRTARLLGRAWTDEAKDRIKTAPGETVTVSTRLLDLANALMDEAVALGAELNDKRRDNDRPWNRGGVGVDPPELPSKAAAAASESDAEVKGRDEPGS